MNGAVIGDTRVRVLCEIVRYEREHGYGPALRDLMGPTGLSLSTVHVHVCALNRDGLVAWTKGTQRTLHSLVEVVA